MKKLLLRTFVLFFSLIAVAIAQPTQPVQQALPQLADRIVAVVNDDVITLYELQARMKQVLVQLQKQGTPLPPKDVMERQMLERMVMDKLQIQFARQQGWRVEDVQLERAIERIAANNKMSMEQFFEVLQRDGIALDKFREEIRNEMIISQVREREVENRIIISEAEIDHHLSNESAQSGRGDEYEVAHILLRVPESASPEQLKVTEAKAKDIVARLQKGEDFSQLAAAYSDAPDALQGGNLGRRPLDRLPGIFAEVVVKLNPGEVGPVLRSSNGFHLMKLVSKTGGQTLPAVEQTHARHILIKVNEVVPEAEAKHKLDVLHERIQHGEDFAELAKLYSQDGSASKGGDLGWVYPGDTVPEFERAMNGLKPGEVSEPVKSPFGYHLISVIERRVQDVSSDRHRAIVRQTLRDRKFDESYQDWLRQLRDRAHVEIRLEDTW